MPPDDIAPIVVYPDFLARAPAPPSLLTPTRLLNAVWAAGGIAAGAYLISRAIFAPMHEAQTERRHDLAAHAHAHLDQLNSRLSTMVSSDPAAHGKAPDTTDDVANSDLGSDADLEPTELFHRNAGTQTTPSLSRRPSIDGRPDVAFDPIAADEARLRSLNKHLVELNGLHYENSTLEPLHLPLEDVVSKINQAAEAARRPVRSYGASYGDIPLGSRSDDAFENIMMDVRAIKGRLLSTNAFPPASSRPRS